MSIQNKLPQTPYIGAYLMLIMDNKILLQKRKGGIYDGKYSLVAGHTEEGETVIEAVVREAFEESNIIIDPAKLKIKVAVHRPQSPYKNNIKDIIDFFAFTDNYQGTIKNNEEDRCYKLGFYPIDNLPKETIPYIKNAINAYKENKFYITYQSE